MLKLIVKKVAGIVNADVCMIHLLNKGDLTLKISYSLKGGMAAFKKTLPLKGNVIARAIRSKKTIKIDEDIDKYLEGAGEVLSIKKKFLENDKFVPEMVRAVVEA